MNELAYLPEGFSIRPVTLEDIPAAVELFNQTSVEMIGSRDFTPKEIEKDWTTPGVAPETDFRAVISPDGLLVGYVEVWTIGELPVHPWVWGRVHPDFKGLGIGTALLTWAERRASQVIETVPPDARVAFRSTAFDTHQPSNDLLNGYGMKKIRHSFQMRIRMTEKPPEPVWPEGISVRTFRPEDLEAVYRADEEAFQDHFGHTPQEFEAGLARFRHMFVEDEEGFDPELWFLAMDGEEIAGISLCRKQSWEDKDLGWVSSLAVRRPWRKCGIGLALLQESFNAFWQRGKKSVGLGVDGENLTGALRLYKKAGMKTHRQHNMYEKELRPGREYSTH
ncbi:MAG: GNAT family N-acetyltransferase [Anaerolineales bacterium]|nr:GNAT family N-acetyltransferase [Anaerolineales bacterium]